MNFNHWDIILFIPLAWAAWRGFSKGLIIELASIAALIAGIYVAANFSELLGDLVQGWMESEASWIGYVAFFLTFIAVVFGVYALAKLLEKAVNLAMLKLANKLGGLLFGTLKMIIIVSIVLNLLSWLDQYAPVLRKTAPDRSLLFEPLLGAAPALLPVLTHSLWMKKAETMLEPLFGEEEENEAQ